MDDLLSLSALHVFTVVADAASFTRAADQLSTSKSRVSHEVRALEGRLGVPLFLRTTRSVSLTADGEQLLARARELLSAAAELEGAFAKGGAVRGRVRIDLPVGLARNVVLPRLAELHQRHPQLELAISSTDRYVDVVREGFDCVVRVGVPADSSLVAVRVGSLPMMNVCSPAYVAARGRPASVHELASHLLVHYAPTLTTSDAAFEWLDGDVVRSLAMRSLVVVNSTDAFRAAAVAGLGIAQVPRIGIAPLLAAGELVEVLPEACAPALPIAILHAHGKRVPRRVRAVMDWLMATVEPHVVVGAVGSISREAQRASAQSFRAREGNEATKVGLPQPRHEGKSRRSGVRSA